MKDTKLFQIISKMPKGSLLHCHLGAMVDFTWVFNITIDTPRMCILATAPLILGESMERAEVKIEYSKLGAAGPQIWTEYYVPGTHVTLKEAAESFPDGGRDGFVAWMKGRCSITKEHVQSSHLGVNDIWKTLSRGFVAITPVVFYEPITRKFLREFFRTAMADGITWIEMRGMTRSFRLEGQDELTKDRTELVRVIHEEVKKFKASAEGEGFWGVRMIWDCLRTFDDQTILNGNVFDPSPATHITDVDSNRHASMPPGQTAVSSSPLRLRPCRYRGSWSTTLLSRSTAPVFPVPMRRPLA